MRRLIANHVGPLSHECVEKDIKDQTRIKGRQSSDSYLIAKQICCDSVLAVTNENILKVDKLINAGAFSDLGRYKDNKAKWIERTEDLYRNNGLMIKKSKYTGNAYSIAEDLCSKIPLVPTRELVQDISQDIQAGLYDELGEYEANSYEWLENCRNLLKMRNAIAKRRRK